MAYILLVAFIIGIAGCAPDTDTFTSLTIEQVEGILPGTWNGVDVTRTYVFTSAGTYTDTSNDIVRTGRWSVHTRSIPGVTIQQIEVRLCDDRANSCLPHTVGATITFQIPIEL